MDVDEDEKKAEGTDGLQREVSFSDKVERIAKRSPPTSNGKKPAKRVKSAA